MTYFHFFSSIIKVEFNFSIQHEMFGSVRKVCEL